MKRWLISILFLSLTLPSGPAWADEQRVDVDVPAGELADAVDRLARQTKLQVIYDPKLLEGKTTPGLHGSYTAQEAIEKLLEGSGIQFRFTAADAVALSPAAEATTPTELPEVKVTAPPESGYVELNAGTATKTDTVHMLRIDEAEIIMRIRELWIET